MTSPTGASSRAASRPSDPWTTRTLLNWMRQRFEQQEIDSPRVVAEMLLAHVLNCDRMRLYMEVDRPASPDELATLRNLVQRADQHEPVQYLVGEAHFYGRLFQVNRSTLIPRPSTETLIDRALQLLNNRCESLPPPLIADIGTGTGCIAITIAAQIPRARIIATDIVPEALQLAARNAQRHSVADRIEFRIGDLLEPLQHELFDLICSNPPYISDHEWEDVAPNVREHEPHTALRAGPDGLQFIRPLINDAPPLLHPGGRLLLEIAQSHHCEVLQLAQQHPQLSDVELLKDHENLERILCARRM